MNKWLDRIALTCLFTVMVSSSVMTVAIVILFLKGIKCVS
jgi:hypothetical protein